ncbi:MAG: TIGR04053 family radical SAM/SPASM domain-containing protein [Desulfurococcales archaeon]|nr:TIGR04053 family radical SAM/SPASM domain-containing protein [Desulfurococcales archaeon]
MRWPAREKPLLVFWETTKACMLSCRHCRAEAIKNPLPGELDTKEAFKLIDMITEFGQPYPILVLTGGDPLMRKDIEEIVDYAVDKKIKTALSPAVTELLERNIKWIAKSGINAVSISIDSASPNIHDEIRGIQGVWERSIKVTRELLSKGVNVQINSVVMNSTKEGLADLFALIKKLGVNVWEVFYLVPTGRASSKEMLSPRDWEDVSHFLYEASKYGVIIRTTEGPMYRRVAWIRSKLEEYGYEPDELLSTGKLYTRLVNRLRSILGENSSKPNIPRMFTRDGLGIVFVSYDGNVYPSGFLKLSAGNIRFRSLSDIYRHPRIFQLLRGAKFKGRCGECEFRSICGGSRARAFSVYGDPLESDPACDYKPGEYRGLVNELGLNEVLPR